MKKEKQIQASGNLESALVSLSKNPDYSNSNLPILCENAASRVSFENAGKNLLARIQKEGMSDVLLYEGNGYLAQCSSEVSRMHENRRVITDPMATLLKKFTALENAIDPQKTGSPAFEINVYIKNFLKKKIAAEAAEEQRLQKNFERSEKRIAGHASWTEEQKNEAIKRAGQRQAEGIHTLKINEVETELIPVPNDPNGYLEILKFWWQEIGRNLPDDDLQRIFRPMLSYARKQVRKGMKVDSVYVDYLPEPKNKKAA